MTVHTVVSNTERLEEAFPTMRRREIFTNFTFFLLQDYATVVLSDEITHQTAGERRPACN